jgi:hypothetical protein
MTQTHINYSVHGTARVAVVACPKIFGNRLVFLSTKSEYSWAFRDFITGFMLRSGGAGELKLSEIEAMITYSETPAYRSVDRKTEWARELENLSRNQFGTQYDGTAPPKGFGRWKRI